jgi:hypothetical protein
VLDRDSTVLRGLLARGPSQPITDGRRPPRYLVGRVVGHGSFQAGDGLDSLGALLGTLSGSCSPGVSWRLPHDPEVLRGRYSDLLVTPIFVVTIADRKPPRSPVEQRVEGWSEGYMIV